MVSHYRCRKSHQTDQGEEVHKNEPSALFRLLPRLGQGRVHGQGLCDDSAGILTRAHDGPTLSPAHWVDRRYAWLVCKQSLGLNAVEDSESAYGPMPICFVPQAFDRLSSLSYLTPAEPKSSSRSAAVPIVHRVNPVTMPLLI